jgi:hypothetical protein
MVILKKNKINLKKVSMVQLNYKKIMILIMKKMAIIPKIKKIHIREGKYLILKIF